MTPSKRTKIVCTIGPTSNTDKKIRALLKSGMNVARLNFSHGTHKEHAAVIKRLRAAAADMDVPLAILQDLQGPKIRVGELPKEGVKLEHGSKIIFTTGKSSIASMRLPVTYNKLHTDVKAGERILLDDGLLSVRIMSVKGKDIVCKVVDGGLLMSHKGLNLPNTKLSVSAITEKDINDAKFGVAQHVDWVALSFVRTAKEIYLLRKIIEMARAELSVSHHQEFPIRLIAKIEKPEGVKNIGEIIEAADGIMVARGDLGIEMPAEDVPLIQKRLISLSRAAARPVVVATQMLDSMIRNPRPTRAEVSDVANAVIDHTDAVMLSGETANGKYPVESVHMMSKVIEETERSKYDDLAMSLDVSAESINESISEVANILARGVKAKLILVASMSGDMARLVSRYRPELLIVAITSNERVERQLSLSWGVLSFCLPRCSTVKEFVDRSIKFLKKKRLIKKGEKIVVIAGESIGLNDSANLVEIRTIV